jgi:septum site-determining protein MinD
MKTITIHSFKGGTGKTNIIASLSYTLASAGYRVGVVDSDLAHPSLHIVFGLGGKQPHPTLTEFLLERCKALEIVHDISQMYNLKQKLYLIPANLDEDSITRLVRGGFEVAHLFHGLREIGGAKNLDFLLIDTKPGLDEKTMLFLMMTNALLIVLRNDEVDIRGTETLLKIVDTFHVPLKYIIPNMIDSSVAPRISAELQNKFGDEVKVTAPLPYSTKLAIEHSPHIDKLFACKYPEDPLVQAIFKLTDTVRNDMGEP